MQTHGRQFADAFMYEYRAAILKVVQARLCGRTENALGIDIARLRSAYRDV